MTNAVLLISKYQTWIYCLLGLIALFYLRRVWQARWLLSRSVFGLEKEAALNKQHGALAMLCLVAALAASVFVINRAILPNVNLARATPGAAARPTPMPSVTPPRILPTLAPGTTPQPLAVDSSGCSNPEATLTAPQPNERISGSYEVRGTANIPNFAFYKFEISGYKTNGAWVTLKAGTAPVVNGSLGSFETSAYGPGEYAFRLVVMDSTGNFPPPCEIAVTIEGAAQPTP